MSLPGAEIGTGGAALPDTAVPWLLRVTPAAWRPYIKLARLDRPIGWQLLVLPCWWSAALAADSAGHLPNLTHCALFLLGAMAMRGAGSTFNDIVDRDIDRRVERTRGRPVASGDVSVKAAALFLVAQALVGAVVLLSLNGFAILVGLCSLLVVALYPFAKRVTHWPQAVLGLAFSWGALMGWAALFGALGWPAFGLYLASFFWIIGYDTIYAMQDTTDDAIVGIGSTALLFGDRVRPAVAVLYGCAVLCLVGACLAARAGPLAALGVAGFAVHLAWQISSLRLDDVSRSLRLFRSNWHAGLILLGGIVLDGLLNH